MAKKYHPKRVEQHQCHICGRLFDAKRFDARYCSPRCRQTWCRDVKRRSRT